MKTVSYERRGAVALVTLDRPDVLNALNQEMRDDLLEATQTADADGEIRAIVITGRGRAFSSGAQLGGGGRDAPVRTPHDWYLTHERNDRWASDIRDLHKPTIAAVNGHCYGAGLILAAHCDFILAGSKSRFSLLEARIGSAGAATLPFLVGPQWAKFLILTGEIISAHKAAEIGLALEVVADESLIDRALELGGRIAAMPPIGVTLNKRGVNGTLDLIGWADNRVFSRSHAALTDAMIAHAVASGGEILMETLRADGWEAFKEARDRAFERSWLEPDDAG